MQKIEFNGVTYFFELQCGEYSTSTLIYSDKINKRVKKYKKYIFFGPIVEKTIEDYEYLFTLYFDITSAYYTKEYVRNEFEIELKKYEGLKQRIKDIKNGIYI